MVIQQRPLAKNKPSRKRQWLWFIGLYLASVLAIGTVAGLIKLLIPH